MKPSGQFEGFYGLMLAQLTQMPVGRPLGCAYGQKGLKIKKLGSPIDPLHRSQKTSKASLHLLIGLSIKLQIAPHEQVGANGR